MLNIFLIKDWFYSQVFAKTLVVLGFRCIIISDKFKFPVFRVKILPQKMHHFFLKLMIMLNLLKLTSNNGFAPTSTTVFYDFAQF